MELKFMDVREIHEFSDIGRAFFENMAHTDLLKLFDLPIVRNMIKFKWPIVKQNTIYYLFIPFIGFITSTSAYTSYLLHAKVNDEEPNWILELVIRENMFIFSLYFFFNELLQL
jgi:hypothetical protein